MHKTAQGIFIKMEKLLAFTPQQKAKWVTGYHQTGSITHIQRNYRATYVEGPTARDSLPRWAQNFQTYAG